MLKTNKIEVEEEATDKAAVGADGVAAEKIFISTFTIDISRAPKYTPSVIQAPMSHPPVIQAQVVVRPSVIQAQWF